MSATWLWKRNLIHSSIARSKWYDHPFSPNQKNAMPSVPFRTCKCHDGLDS